LGVPVVNRFSSNRRDRGGSIDVDYCQDRIEDAILDSVQRGNQSSSIYGDGKSGHINMLRQLPLKFHKTIMY
jgi:hypothetical protein